MVPAVTDTSNNCLRAIVMAESPWKIRLLARYHLFCQAYTGLALTQIMAPERAPVLPSNAGNTPRASNLQACHREAMDRVRDMPTT